MPGKFEALEELLDEVIELPVCGKTYSIPSPSAKDGLRVEQITNLAIRAAAGGDVTAEAEALNDDEERDLFQLCLGPVYNQMLADGVSWTWLRHAGLTAMVWISSGLTAAERFWQSAGNPETEAPNREARRSGSAAASKTRSRGSSSGTNRRRGTSRPRQVPPS
jgi:hypothetical protein